MLLCVYVAYLAAVCTARPILPPRFHPAQASTELLHSHAQLEACMDARMALMAALARQWYGALMLAR